MRQYGFMTYDLNRDVRKKSLQWKIFQKNCIYKGKKWKHRISRLFWINKWKIFLIGSEKQKNNETFKEKNDWISQRLKNRKLTDKMKELNNWGKRWIQEDEWCRT